MIEVARRLPTAAVILALPRAFPLARSTSLA
jgi:hypothetical protein